MYRTLLRMLGWLGCLAAIGQVPMALAATISNTDDQTQPSQVADTKQQSIQESYKTDSGSDAQARHYEAQPAMKPQEQNAAPVDTQKPRFTEDVQLRVETYTGNDYSK